MAVQNEETIETDTNTLSLLEKREIGDEAVWSLSSAKPGNGLFTTAQLIF